MFKLPSMESVSEIIVDLGVVKNNTEPKVVHAKNKKTTASVDLDKYLPDSDATHHQNNAPRRTR